MPQEHLGQNEPANLLPLVDALIALTRRVEILNIVAETTVQVEQIQKLYQDELKLHNSETDPMRLAFNAAATVAKAEIKKSKARRDPSKVIKVLETFLTPEEPHETN